MMTLKLARLRAQRIKKHFNVRSLLIARDLFAEAAVGWIARRRGLILVQTRVIPTRHLNRMALNKNLKECFCPALGLINSSLFLPGIGIIFLKLFIFIALSFEKLQVRNRNLIRKFMDLRLNL